jgi:hypothetical protein
VALSAITPWHYFHLTVQATALAALRARMGTTYTSDPVDADLVVLLNRCAQLVHKVTGRWFLLRNGSLLVDGNGRDHLRLPQPVISEDQGGTGVTEILVVGDSAAVDEDSYTVNDGAAIGEDDPREEPWVEFTSPSGTSVAPEAARSTWPRGRRNLQITADWGYLEEDGTTPEAILHVLARLCVMNAVDGDDLDGQEDKRRGALLIEQTRGRMTQLQQHAAGFGLTTDREIDGILRMYKRPGVAHVF